MAKAIGRWTAYAVFLLITSFASISQAGSFPAATKQAQSQLSAELKAARFLTHASFGPSKAEIAALAEQILLRGDVAAFEGWIDAQFNLPVSYHEPLAKQMILDDGFVDFVADGISTSRYRDFAWWHTALTAPDQLRQRMAWALAQIFVINQNGNGFGSRDLEQATGEPQYLGIVNYYDMLIRNALGNYRDLLGDVTLHPIMGVFLSYVNNPKATATTEPDENYAREVQQLFSIGLYELTETGEIQTVKKSGELVASYDNEDIRAFARAFTGLGFAGAPRFGSNQRNFHQPMVMYEEYHDTGAKTLLRGTELPAGQSGMQDIDAALDNLYQHPNVGPFMARLLIQRFVKSNPSKNYIRDVARVFADNGAGERGDFKAVLKKILLHTEALNTYSLRVLKKTKTLEASGGGTEDSRLQEPVLRYSAFLRAFDPTTDHRQGYFAIGDMSHWLNQQVYRAPHVFNFYLPDHTPAGEMQTYRTSRQLPNHALYAPEFEILTSVAANRIANRFRSDVLDADVDLSTRDATGSYSFDVLLDFSEEEALAADPAALLRHLNLLLCRGLLKDSAREQLADILAQETTDLPTRAKGAILALLTAPDCAVHE